MKILIIEPSGRRGLCHYTHNLGNAIAAKGHRILLATSEGFETREYPRSYDAIEVFRRFSPRPAAWLRFLRAAQAFKPDIIHIQGSLHPLAYLILWKIQGMLGHKRLVYTAHEIFPKKGGLFSYGALRKIYQGAFHIIVHAEQNRCEIMEKFGIAAEKISILSVGNNMALFQDQDKEYGRAVNVAEKRKIILFFGIIEPHKGLMTLLRAMPEIRRQCPTAFLRIVGQPFEAMAGYVKEVERLGIRDSLEMRLGYVPITEIPAVFHGAALVVLPYIRASQSGVLLSAYAFGKPVVATTAGGMAELVVEGKTGFLVPPEDSQALAEAVARMLNDEELRAGMGRQALAYLEANHSWEAIAAGTEAIYQAVTASGR